VIAIDLGRDDQPRRLTHIEGAIDADT
jgi:hypothetical protein